MKQRQNKSILAGMSVASFCLLVICSPASGVETDGSTATVNKADTGAARDQGDTEPKHQDVLDKVFSPLDDAVSDINRDLNKGDAGTTADPEE